jgi:hypothetical protein
MAIKSSKSAHAGTSNHAARVLGRSAATGHYVLRPASKPGAISIAAARAAVKSIYNDKKK